MDPSRRRHPRYDGDVVYRLPLREQTFDLSDSVKPSIALTIVCTAASYDL
jgi:hypothetical protein